VSTDTQRSIDRAIALLRTPRDYEKYVSMKLRPLEDRCSCLRHWPGTWTLINKYIHPCGPVEDRGDALIRKDGGEFVLECHESGPEVVICVSAVVNALAAVADLIVTILHARASETRESHRPRGSVELTVRQIEHGECIEEIILRTDGSSPRLAAEVREAIQDSKLLAVKRSVGTRKSRSPASGAARNKARTPQNHHGK